MAGKKINSGHKENKESMLENDVEKKLDMFFKARASIPKPVLLIFLVVIALMLIGFLALMKDYASLTHAYNECITGNNPLMGAWGVCG